MFFLLFENDSEEICFSSILENQERIQFFFMKKQKFFFSWKFCFSPWKRRSRLLCCEKKKNDSRMHSFIHDLKQENWLVKQPIWILGISKSNREALFLIIGIRTPLSCFLPFGLFVFSLFKKKKNVFFEKEMNKVKKILVVVQKNKKINNIYIGFIPGH